jgi:flagellar hook protein FlgE
MGIFDALTTAVAGLQAQSFALQNISGNIANSQTTGYKEIDTSFADLVSQASLNLQSPDGVVANSVATNSVQGTIQSTSVATDMAINGDGYFIVEQPIGTVDNEPQFNGVNYYTRAGNFQLNQNGYMVNGAGAYLMGIPIDPTTGNPVGSVPQILQFNNNFEPAQATSTIQYQANLPSTPTSGVLNPADFSVNPLAAGTGTVVGNDASTFTNESIDGGSITTYDSKGNPVNVEFRWAQTASSSGSSSWELFYQSNPSATGTQVAWQNTGTSFTFNGNGVLTPPVSSVTLSNLTVGGDTVGDVQMNFGSNALTQFADSSGTAQVNQLQQNGFAAGQLQSISVDNQGRISGSFSNGQTIPLAEVPLARFGGEDSLQAINGGLYAATPESGPPTLDATGKIVGSSLEASNVDIATQFSQLIVAQQAYSANARVMTTADQMIQSLLTVIQ